MGRRRQQVPAVVALLALVLASCASKKTCTDLACNSGLAIAFEHPFALDGAYQFIVEMDGQETICEATLPPPDKQNVSCVKGDIEVQAEPIDATTYGFRRIISPRTDVTNVSIKVMNGRYLVGQWETSPKYVTSPGPNGPSCAPETCSLASATMPTPGMLQP